MDGIDKLVDVALEFLGDVLPWKIVNMYDEAVLLRFGKTYKVLKPGFHWKIPFVDNPMVVTVVTSTLSIPVQSVITNDQKEVAVKAVVKYSIKDVVAYSENIYDAKDAISDLTQGFIAEVVNSKSWEECRDTKKLSQNITTRVRAGVKKYGIDVEAVTITDFVKTPSFRMFGDSNTEKLF